MLAIYHIPPGHRMPYKIDWDANDWLPAGESIDTSTWEVSPAGLAVENPAFDAGAAVGTVNASGSQPGASFRVTNTIVTAPGGYRDSATLGFVIES